MTDEATPQVLLTQARLPVGGLHRRHREQHLGAVASAITGAFRDQGPVRLGPRRNLVVIAVDGLGYPHAARALRPDVFLPLTSEFPTTTIACLLTSVTGQPADTHGFIGVQYLHADGLRTVNCHDGQVADPTGPAPARPTRTPELPTVFDVLARDGIPTTVLPGELAGLHSEVLGRLLHGADQIAPALPPAPDPLGRMRTFGDQISELAAARPAALTWAYLDLDTHIHRHGFDDKLHAAAVALDGVVQRLRADGAAVLVFSDHGLTPNHPSADTLAAWQAATSERWCRLPAGGAGRTRWIYPHPRYADRLAGQLAEQIPDATVVGHEQLAQWGLVAPGSVGQRRLGEIILLAHGPDFPAPDTTTGYEHGSMTADEVLVPLAIWHPAT
ncbi:MAG TPA: alkaline phosphatase family protein [Streptosporangiaceae bacterium]|nr:alkaline phosphatase family protein [Streptosporangiaceae bacterium]